LTPSRVRETPSCLLVGDRGGITRSADKRRNADLSRFLCVSAPSRRRASGIKLTQSIENYIQQTSKTPVAVRSAPDSSGAQCCWWHRQRSEKVPGRRSPARGLGHLPCDPCQIPHRRTMLCSLWGRQALAVTRGEGLSVKPDERDIVERRCASERVLPQRCALALAPRFRPRLSGCGQRDRPAAG
jgi:hypothetical protein